MSSYFTIHHGCLVTPDLLAQIKRLMVNHNANYAEFTPKRKPYLGKKPKRLNRPITP